ncbi:hypothetical protein MRX96_003572 [Rhipicephalus microplus]
MSCFPASADRLEPGQVHAAHAAAGRGSYSGSLNSTPCSNDMSTDRNFWATKAQFFHFPPALEAPTGLCATHQRSRCCPTMPSASAPSTDICGFSSACSFSRNSSGSPVPFLPTTGVPWGGARLPRRLSSSLLLTTTLVIIPSIDAASC